MGRAKMKPRRVLPVLVSETVQCTRLRCSLALGSCVARWQRAQDRSCVRIDGHLLSGKGDAGLAYLSCRHCPEGRERAQGVANDNGGGR